MPTWNSKVGVAVHMEAGPVSTQREPCGEIYVSSISVVFVVTVSQTHLQAFDLYSIRPIVLEISPPRA